MVADSRDRAVDATTATVAQRSSGIAGARDCPVAKAIASFGAAQEVEAIVREMRGFHGEQV